MTAKGTVLITGGSRGIGAATVRLAAKRGYAVCFSYRSNTDAAEQLVQEVEAAGGRALAVQSDVGDGDAIKQLFDRCDRQFGPISALVNNAGITGGISRLDAVEPETVRRVLEVNVLGTILCCQEAVRRMSTAHGGTGGAIVNISSGVTRSSGASEYVWYGATKGAVDTFTIGLAREVGPEGIRINAVAPGLTQTGIHAEGGDAARLDRTRHRFRWVEPRRPKRSPSQSCGCCRMKRVTSRAKFSWYPAVARLDGTSYCLTNFWIR